MADIATTLAFVAAAIALWATWAQLRQNTKVRRAQSLLDATQHYFADPDARQLYYDIDYGKFAIHFDGKGEPETFTRCGNKPQGFIGSPEERHLDSLLYSFDTVGRMVEIGALDRKEATLFTFQANRVFSDESVTTLLKWLDKERGQFGGEVPTHKAGRDLAKVSP
jgi:hypothetical protein